MTRYVALLRGINVGGRNLISMPQLKACFESAGFVDVATYIQSGNVIFSAPSASADALETMLFDAFNLEIRLVVRARQQMARVISDAPAGFGEDPVNYRYDVIFLKEPLTAFEAMKDVTTKDGVDAATLGSGVLYYARLASKASQSHLTRVMGKPVYKQMTIRNWNTTTRLHAMLRE